MVPQCGTLNLQPIKHVQSITSPKWQSRIDDAWPGWTEVVTPDHWLARPSYTTAGDMDMGPVMGDGCQHVLTIEICPSANVPWMSVDSKLADILQHPSSWNLSTSFFNFPNGNFPAPILLTVSWRCESSRHFCAIRSVLPWQGQHPIEALSNHGYAMVVGNLIYNHHISPKMAPVTDNTR